MKRADILHRSPLHIGRPVPLIKSWEH